MINIRRKPPEDVRSPIGRAQDAARQGAELCRQGASSAAERIMPVAGERVMIVRGWSAPRLQRAARYVETGLAPRVSSFLSDVAHRVEPPKPAKPGRGGLMTMMGVVAAVGVAGAVATRRGALRDLTKGSDEHAADATSADSMTVSGSDVDGQVQSPH
ncbi:hypothetical protein D0T12_01745 [Actinomadura spongiicola]|uniref:Uncharacterized protein n=1 Tax=Actinomadura spongiicola TaxID=2303421 RepID=A0A372GNQ8_9ACTN|nr:hypothetical protein [Actinomadura spongiicola]RFS87004.1 hypothetical protein D0T12_01745 [Actinomadura spongiicola]